MAGSLTFGKALSLAEPVRLPNPKRWRQRATSSVPIVFAFVVDPVGAGFITSLARPGGNITGFTAFEYSISGKWLELLKKIAPNVTRVAVLRDPAVAAGIGQFAASSPRCSHPR